MPQHPNFYENTKEAQMRLRSTVVLYNGEPHIVLAITNHKNDGIFRIYLEPTGWDPKVPRKYPAEIVDNYPSDHPSVGPMLDTWMDQNPGHKILRKQMNSPMFNKFRPYPLGMCNVGPCTYYVERQPNRRTEQGLTRSMLYETLVTTGSRQDSPRRNATVDLFSPAFKACVVGDHPSAKECLAALLDKDIENDAVAFDRSFALVRGPIDMIFLAYKADIIGVLPKNNFDYLRIGRPFLHCREVVEGLHLFANIIE